MSTAEPTVLLATKLHVPALRRKLISRAALVAALSAGRSHKLTLLDAPAGWGKTTLLAQWVTMEQDRHRFGWLSLDPADNDPARFWTYLVAALQKAHPEMISRAVELLEMRADPLQVVLPTLINELVVLDDEIVLVLDDYHLVTDRAIHQQLAFAINRMPPNLRLVVATRSDPPLPLARLRAGGELLEVRTHDLRFVTAEAALLLNDVLGLDLAQEEVTLLCQRTEGWAAGLYLAALSLEGRVGAGAFVRAFAGDDRHIVDYLSAEVLDGQPTDLRAFLVRTSVLERLSGPLCDAVLQTSGSAAILERIERENLFLIPLDAARRWYRYHQLFAELLRNELQRTEPDLVPGLHHRAAAWFRGQNSPDDEVRHLVAAGDVPGSTELIAASWAAEFNRGRLSTVARWLDLLPERTVAEDPRLCLARTWIALDRGQLPDAGRWIEAAKTGLTAGCAAPGGAQADLAVVRALHRFKIGDVGAAVDVARRAIQLAGDQPHDDSALGRCAIYCVYGAALYWSGRIPEAVAAFRRAVQLADDVDNQAGRTYALGYLAVISVDSGHVTEAEQLIGQATGDDRDVAVSEHFVDMMPTLARAKILDRRDETALAEDAARRAVVLSQRGGGNLEVAHALLTRATILQHLGEQERAAASMQQARTLLRHCRVPGTAQQLRAIAERRTVEGASRRRDRPGYAEELTTKELDVLRLLATPLSRREIGARLYVSLNTVKTHQRSLYRKLDVVNRTMAVARARELGLL